MVYVGMALGVLWLAVVLLVLAMCRAAGRADQAHEPVATPGTRPAGPVTSAPADRLARRAPRPAGGTRNQPGRPRVLQVDRLRGDRTIAPS
jgi:hypothetical protein